MKRRASRNLNCRHDAGFVEIQHGDASKSVALDLFITVAGIFANGRIKKRPAHFVKRYRLIWGRSLVCVSADYHFYTDR